MQLKIFISYRRKTWGFTHRLAERLSQLIEGDIFIDIDSIDESNFERSILKHLQESSIVLVVIAEETFNPDRIFKDDDWVRLEIRTALELAKTIVLIFVDGQTPPKPELLPSDIRQITKIQGIQFYPEYFSVAVERLVNFIRKLTLQKIKVNPAPVPEEGDVPPTKETFEEAIKLLNQTDYDKAIFLLEALQNAGFHSQFFDLGDILHKAIRVRDENQRTRKMNDEYEKIVILTRSQFTIDTARHAWTIFRHIYPDFVDDRYNLTELLDIVEVNLFEDLPQRISYKQVLKVDTIDDEYIFKLWFGRQRNLSESVLDVPIGMMADGTVKELHFSDDVDGTHALFSGAVESGKSELLRTLILGLALQYPPEKFRFVLFDYAGRGLHKKLGGLPHFEKVIEEDALDSPLQLLNWLKDTLVHRRSYVVQPELNLIYHQLPYLFVVLDEYPEMFLEYPEFRSELETLSRIGYELNVVVIFSAQRSAGAVSSVIRENARIRLSFRTETREESLEILNTPDAAYLPNIPGRALIQIGNSVPVLTQIAMFDDVAEVIQMINRAHDRHIHSL